MKKTKTKDLLKALKSFGISLKSGDELVEISEEQSESLALLKSVFPGLQKSFNKVGEELDKLDVTEVLYSGSFGDSLVTLSKVEEESGLSDLSEAVLSFIELFAEDESLEIKGVEFSSGKFDKEKSEQWLEERKLSFSIFKEEKETVSFFTEEVDKDSLTAYQDGEGIKVFFGKKRAKENTFKISKAYWGSEVSSLLKEEDEDEQFTMGIVLEPTDGSDGDSMNPDTDNDVYSAEEVRKAAHWYMTNGRKKGILHGPKRGGFILDPDDTKIVVVESYLTPIAIPVGTLGERQTEEVKKGTWIIAHKINDSEIWEAIKSGVYNALSIGGGAVETPIE